MLAAILLLLFQHSKAQTAADSISVTFPKILVVNKQKEVLLIFDKNRQAYEVPGYDFSGPVTYKNLIDTAAADMGILYNSFRMGGTFIYKYPSKYRTIIRPYFVVQCNGYTNGNTLKDTSAFKWFSLNEAVKAIPYPASARIVERIMHYPAKNWAATFEEYGYTNPVNREKITFKILEDFYPL